MSRPPADRAAFGREVLGPIVAEFCLRLWSLTALMVRPEDAGLLFCARGGLRLQLAYERFLAATALPSRAHVAPLMVSRLAAVRPAVQRTLDEGLDTLVPSAAAALSYEFRRATVGEVFTSLTGESLPPGGDRWGEPFSPDRLVALLRHPDGWAGTEQLTEQARLFTRHLEESLGGRRTAVLVDTGLFGTTRDLLADGLPALDVSCALMARSYRPKVVSRDARTAGLSVEAYDYSPLRPRTALLRYWHFVEWLFEPELPSVRTFVLDGNRVRSNLEIDGWETRLPPLPGTCFAGVLEYLEALPHGPAKQVIGDARRAWPRYRRAVVWPRRVDGEVLSVGTRSHDFGRDETWTEAVSASPLAALRGNPMWREGDVARTGSPLRGPLLLAIEGAYGLRSVTRTVQRRYGRAGGSGGQGPQAAGGRSHVDAVGFGVPGHDGAGADDAARGDRDAGEHDDVRSEPRPAAHDHR